MGIIWERHSENRASKFCINSSWTKHWIRLRPPFFFYLSKPEFNCFTFLQLTFFGFLSVLMKQFACLSDAENSGIWGRNVNKSWFSFSLVVILFCLQWIMTWDFFSLPSLFILISIFLFFFLWRKLLLVSTLIHISSKLTQVVFNEMFFIFYEVH